MAGFRGKLAALDAGVRNAWLLTATLIVALVCTAETVAGFASGDMATADCLAAFAFIAVIILMAFRPVTGCVLTAALWTALCLSPMAMPSAMMLAILLAVGIAGYTDKRLAVAVTSMALLAWLVHAGVMIRWPWGSGSTNDMAAPMPDAPASSGLPHSGDVSGDVSGGLSGSDGVAGGSAGGDDTGAGGSDGTGGSDDSSGSTGRTGGQLILGTVALYGVMPVAVLFVGFLLGGIAARWNHERSMARAELAHRRQRERAAQDIHDYVSNDLAYLILRFDKDIADGKAPSVQELRELRGVAAGALDRTHQVIGVIEGRGEADARAADAREPDGGALDGASRAGGGRRASRSEDGRDCPLAEQIRGIAGNGDQRLAELGFDGQTIVSGANGEAGRSDLVAGLLEELYGNIAKHADPEAGYVMTIGIGLDAVRIACIDTVRTPSDADGDAELSTGTGLNRYRRLLERHGGALHIATQDAEWTLSATVPVKAEPRS